MVVALLVTRVDAGRMDHDLDARVLDALGDVEPPLELPEAAPHLGDHHVPRHELDLRMRGVDPPPAHRWQLTAVDDPPSHSLGAHDPGSFGGESGRRRRRPRPVTEVSVAPDRSARTR
jgi:hypothetical protein